MKTKLKIVIFASSSILVLILVLYFCNFIYGYGIATRSINIESVTVSDNIVTISGSDMRDSALAFSGYNIKLNAGQLIFKPRYSLVSYFNRHSSFIITYATKGTPIKEIFIQGNEKIDKKQIWSAK